MTTTDNPQDNMNAEQCKRIVDTMFLQITEHMHTCRWCMTKPTPCNQFLEMVITRLKWESRHWKLSLLEGGKSEYVRDEDEPPAGKAAK